MTRGVISMVADDALGSEQRVLATWPGIRCKFALFHLRKLCIPRRSIKINRSDRPSDEQR